MIFSSQIYAPSNIDTAPIPRSWRRPPPLFCEMKKTKSLTSFYSGRERVIDREVALRPCVTRKEERMDRSTLGEQNEYVRS